MAMYYSESFGSGGMRPDYMEASAIQEAGLEEFHCMQLNLLSTYLG